MDQKRLVKLSKYLSRHLRHQPERLGLTPAPGGWVPVEVLLRACAARSVSLTRAELQEVVDRNDKQRFSFDAAGTCIRANQGHTIELDLQLQASAPPSVLYHGTGQHSLASILQTGLDRQARHHVHLSRDIATARSVGRRHGPPIVLEVNADRMVAAGHLFYLTENGVWLTLAVPAAYLKPLWDRAAER